MFVPASPSSEERYLSSLDLAGKTVYDVGANIGVMSLFFAQEGRTGWLRHCDSSPIRIQCPHLTRNIQCNDFQQIRVL